MSTKGNMWPDGMLGEAFETKLVLHIKTDHKFNKEKGIADSDWFAYHDMSVQKAEGKGMNRLDVGNYFNLAMFYPEAGRDVAYDDIPRKR